MKKTRLCAFLLCAALLMALLPTAALASGSTEGEGVLSFDATGGKVYYTVDETSNTATIVGCDNSITAVDIPATLDGRPVTVIGANAFDSCTNLLSVMLPDSMTVIGDYAFDHCTVLAELNFPAALQSIGEEAFDNCYALISVTLPVSLTAIGKNAFMNCQELTTADLSACMQLTAIGEGAFFNCQKLATVTLPNTITSLEASAFERCVALTTINLSSLTELTTIGDNAFRNCRLLSTVELPDKVTSLGSAAFRDCSSLVAVTLPEGLVTICSYTFHNATWLSEINLETIEVIEDYAFWNCTSLGYPGDEEEIIELPAVKRVGIGSFGSIHWPLSLRFGDPTVSFRPQEGGDLNDICANDPDEDGSTPTPNVIFYGFAGGDIPLYVNTWKEHPTQIRNYTFVAEGIAQQYTVSGTASADATVKIKRSGVDVTVLRENNYFSATVYDGSDVVVTVSQDGYYSRVIVKTASEFTDNWDLGTVTLDAIPVSGRMSVALTRSDTNQALRGFDGLTFVLHKQGDDTPLTPGTQYEVQYPYIVIKDNSIADNVVLTLTVTPIDSALKLSGGEITGTKRDGKFTLTLPAWGRIQVTTTGSFAGGNNVLIFDVEGNQVQAGATKTMLLDASTSAQVFTSEGLPAGNYTVVAYNKNNLFASVDSETTLSVLGLAAGTDYVLTEDVVVADGALVSKTLAVPLLNLDNKTEVLDNDACSVLLDQSNVIAGHLVTARVFYGLKSAGNGIVNITLPTGAQLNYICSESERLTVTSKYTQVGQTLIIPTTSSSGVFHIGFIIPSAGVHTISATMTNSQNITAPLGSASCSVRPVYLDIPDMLLENRLGNSVKVYAAPGTEVSLYVGDNINPFEATTKLNGQATIYYDLPASAIFGDVFTLRAVVAGGEATDKVSFMPDTTSLKKLSFIHAGVKTIVIDVDNPGAQRSFYTYVADSAAANNYWSFYTEMESAAQATTVTLSVEMMDGSVRTVPMTNISSETLTDGGFLYKYAAELYIEPAGDHVFDKTRIPVRFSVDWNRIPLPYEPNEERVTAEAEARILAREAAVTAAAAAAGYNPEAAEEAEAALKQLFGYESAEQTVKDDLDVLIAALIEDGWTADVSDEAITLFGYGYKVSDEAGFASLPDNFRTVVYEIENLLDMACELYTELLDLPRPIQEYSSWDEVYAAVGVEYTEGGRRAEGENFTQTGNNKYTMLHEGGGFSYVDEGAGNYRLDFNIPSRTASNNSSPAMMVLQSVGNIQHDPTTAGDGIALLEKAIDAEVIKLEQAVSSNAQLLSRNLVNNPTLRGQIVNEMYTTSKYSSSLKVLGTTVGTAGHIMTGQQMVQDSNTYADNVVIIAELNGELQKLDNLDGYYSSEPDAADCLTAIRMEKTKLEELVSMYNDKSTHLLGNIAVGGLSIGSSLWDGGLGSAAAERAYEHASANAASSRDYAIAGTLQEYEQLKAIREELCDKAKERKGRRLTPKLDPSGIVYEALESNPLEGVTATIWVAADQNGSGAREWSEAAEYDEINPQYTGATGAYAWDVPIGWWQVRFSKDGYIDAYTEWMEVPPPRMNLTTPMISTAAPAVTAANAYPEYIEVIFSQYMDKIVAPTLPGGMAGIWQGDESYSKVLRVTQMGGFSGTVGFTLSGAINYAGREMAQYNGSLTVSARPAEIILNYDTTIPMKAGETPSVTVRVKDTEGDYMSGVTVNASITNALLARIDASAVTDAEGKAVFSAEALLPGLTGITFTVSGTSLSRTAALRITVDSQRPARPTAVIGSTALTALSPKENYVTVPPGTTLTLSAESGVTIFYTTNNTCPCQNSISRMEYTGPIVVTENTYFRIAAYSDGMRYSERLNITVTVTGGASPITPPPPVVPEELWENPFTDVAETDWFYDEVRFAYENGLMVGTSNIAFSPRANTTRGMIVTILHRLEELPEANAVNPFDDVAAGRWYTDAVVWAAEQGIVKGYGYGQFGPEDAITREQMAMILMNYAKFKGYDVAMSADLSKYIDAGSISSWAKDAISWANAAALIQGDGAKLTPTGNAERCQVAAILQRFIENVAK